MTDTAPMTDAAPTYAPGTPMWIDLSSTDPAGSARFYGDLFNWQAEDLGPEAGGYRFFRYNGKMVAGVGPTQSPQQPSAWSTYVCTADADATQRAVTDAGGTVVVPAFDVMQAGRMAVFQDPTGAFISVWQPDQHRGAELVNVPNSFCWNELATRDLPTALSFYQRVFNWGVDRAEQPGIGEYITWKLGDRPIGGAMGMGPQFPDNVPSHWLVYFAVADCDGTFARAQQLGAQPLVEPRDIPGTGRFAILSDPQGAAFAVIQLSSS